MGARVGILGGHGKTGRAVSDALVRAGAEARPLGRADLPELAGRLEGCTSLHVIAPNLHPDERAYVAHALAAAEAAGVRRLVYHSVAAPYAPAMPHHLGKAVSEDLVRRSGLDWTILQPGAYVQNFVAALHGPDPVLRVPYSTSARFGLVDLADVGEASARVHLDEAQVGATWELGGPMLATAEDVAEAATMVLGRRVPAVRISAEEWVATDGAGLGDRERDWLLRMFAYYDVHGLPVGPLALAGLLGRAPYSLMDTLGREVG